MTSKEALKKLFFDNKDLRVDITLNDRKVCEIYNIIKDDLERFEECKNENCNYQIENAELQQENKKLKQVIDIFERTHIHIYYLRRTKNVEEYNKMIDIVNEYDFFDYLIQEDYDLLKEVLGNE